MANRSKEAEFHHWITAAAFAVPFFFKPGQRFAKFGLSFSTRLLARSAGAALLSAGTTSFVRGGTMNLARVIPSVAAGYAIGSVVGTGISHALYGSKGAVKAMDFYSDPFDSKKWQTIGSGLKHTLWDSWEL